MSRNRVLLLYCMLVGGAGWLWLLLSLPHLRSDVGPLILFVLLALLIECFGFRTPPSDPHSLAGIVIVTAAFAFSPADSALIGAVEALLFGVLLPFLYNRPRSFFLLVARPFLRSGLRALTILVAAAAAYALAGDTPGRLLLLLCIMASFAVTLQLGRAGRELDIALMVERQQKIDSDLVAAIQFESPEAKRWGSTQLEGAVIDYVAEF
ncbi:MAG: hypothetical protein H7Y32_08100, partial [Chloroflexales bacterium]|nr:hypothetical protein [Chloroflexales bacterium]